MTASLESIICEPCRKGHHPDCEGAIDGDMDRSCQCRCPWPATLPTPQEAEDLKRAIANMGGENVVDMSSAPRSPAPTDGPMVVIDDDEADAEHAQAFVNDVNAFGAELQKVLSESNPQPSVALWTFLTLAIRVFRNYPPDEHTTIAEVLEEVAKYEAAQHAKRPGGN